VVEVKAEGREMESEWKAVRLGEVFDIARGGSPRPIDDFITDDPGGVNWVMISDATSKYITSTKKRITKEGIKRSREVHPGDFLLTNSMSFGRPYIMQTSGCIHDGWLVLSPRTGVSHPDYFYHLLGSDAIYAEFERRAAGATVKNLNIELVKDVEVRLPPLAEQRRIADILDRAEALRAKRRAALTQLDSLTQSIFLELFGDPVTNSKAWKQGGMTEAVVGKFGIKAGPFGSSLKKEDYTHSGYRIYGQEQVIAGRFDIGDYYIGERKYQQLKSCAVSEGDLLVSLVGSFGKVLVVPAGIEPGIINPRLLKITPNQALITPNFFASLLQHPTVQAEFQRVAHGGTMGILNAGLLKQLKVIFPPIPLQHEFARRVAAGEKLKSAHRTSLVELDALFASLQHRAFRREL
jgi:type I restriction enzyme S subunit